MGSKGYRYNRFAKVDGSVVEIWITSGVEEATTSAPDGYESYDFATMEEERLDEYNKENALKLNVHYYDYAQSYDNTECYACIGENAGGAYPLTMTDDYGGVYHVGFTDYENETTVGLTMYINDDEDVPIERTIDLNQAIELDGAIDIYIVQGKSEVWYSQEEADLEPAVTSAEFGDTTKRILISVSKPIDTTDPETEGSHYTVTDQDGKSYDIIKAWSEELGEVSSAYIIMKEPLSLENTYTITRDEYEGTEVRIGNAFSSEEFEESYYYDGNDLGATYTSAKTDFRVWAPTALAVQINLYKTGDGDDLISTESMAKDVKGTWVLEKTGDWNKTYYTYSVTVNGTTNEAVDPYARTTGVNGDRGMVIDLDATDPQGFDEDSILPLSSSTDAVIYEGHVRDLTIDASSGVSEASRGKYLGLTETGTINSEGQSTGIDYLKDLGITHLHLLPVYDYATVDETNLDDNQFNWGYDPKNFNVPEGSYATDPYHGEVRVEEFKEMVQALHENDISVVMDVVYNHTFSIEDSCFQNIVPDYYYRMNGDSYTNGSGCGNETATERLMVRKYIVDSVVYWATEYHVDGFRFDLMGVLDTETMQAIRDALDEVDPSILIYGEGWTGGDSALTEYDRYVKIHTKEVGGISSFSDDIRDTVKGSVFEDDEQGFVSGATGLENAIKYGVVAATDNDQVDYDAYDKTDGWWAGSPEQTINYTSCHDNYTLWDKLAVSNANDSKEDRISMNKLASAIIFTAQGVPFIQAGEEILRSKPVEGEEGVYSDNSYNLSDYTNSIKWNTISENQEVHDYYKGLIAFRKAHGALRMTTTEEVQDNLTFLDVDTANVVAYTIKNSPNEETADTIMVVYNANKEAVDIKLPDDNKWNVYINGETAGTEILTTVKGTATVNGISAMVLVKENVDTNGIITGIVTGMLAVGVVLITFLGFCLSKKRKK